MVSGSVAAGHAATADAAFEILEEGGSAADAAVAGCLASCVAETIMTGLLGGGHGVYLDARDGSVRNLDCFVAVPTGARRRAVAAPGAIRRGARPLRGGAGVVRGARGAGGAGRALARGRAAAVAAAGGAGAAGRAGRRRARAGACRVPGDARAGDDHEPRAQSCMLPAGRCWASATRSSSPGSWRRSSWWPRRVARASTAARSPRLCSRSTASAVTRDDLATYEARWTEPVEVDYAGFRVLTRGGLSGVPETLGRLPRLANCLRRSAWSPSWRRSSRAAPTATRRIWPWSTRTAAPAC